MLDENRIRIMCALEIYKKQHREELESTEKWFRGDYIGTRLLKNGCRMTLAYLAGLCFYLLLHFESVMEKVNAMEVKELGISILSVYAVCLGVYLAVSYLVFSIRYYQAEKRRRSYSRLVEQLEKQYRLEKSGSSRRRQRERGERRR